VLGFYFGSPAFGYFLGNFVSGRYSTRIGIDNMVFFGALVATLATAASLLVFGVGLGTPASFFGFMTIVGIGNGMTIPNATSGMLSVRPHLAGTASGLGGAIMIGFGAILSALAGIILTGKDSAMPVLWLMVASTAGGLLAAAFVIRRAKAIGA
jgi:DHA1 family bicyclomycin/chloramphenicol resistance-like MFS transporter